MLDNPRRGVRGCGTAGCALALVLLGLAASPVSAQEPDLTGELRQRTADPVLTDTGVRYDATIRNVGVGAAASAPLRVDFPAVFRVERPAASGMSCNVVVAEGFQRVICQGDALGRGASRRLSISATTPRTISGVSQAFDVVLTVDPGNLVPEVALGEGFGRNTTTITTHVTTAPDLDPTWSGSPTTLSPPSDATYRVTLQNTGDRIATLAGLRVSIPLGQVNFVRFENTTFSRGCTQPDSQGVFSCLDLTLGAGRSVRTDIVVRPSPLLADRDQLLFGATADPENRIAEHSETNNVSSIVTRVSTTTDLRLDIVSQKRLQASAGPGAAMMMLVGTFRVVNAGPSAFTGGARVVIDGRGETMLSICAPGSQVDLNSGIACITSNLPAGCHRQGSALECELGSMGPGQGQTFAFGATTAPGSLQGRVSITATVDPDNRYQETNESNNSATLRHTF